MWINVAVGHRLGTREIEESASSHPGVAEVAVVGVKDALKGQVSGSVCHSERERQSKIVMWRICKRGDYGAGGQPDWQLWPPGARLVCLAIAQKNAIRKKCCAARSVRRLRRTRSLEDLTTIDDPASADQIRRGDGRVSALVGCVAWRIRHHAPMSDATLTASYYAYRPEP